MMSSEQEIDERGSDSFSSMDSNQQQPNYDQQGFQLHQHHREKDIGFPPVPPHLPKLYQIYLHNAGRKKELQSALEGFIQKQIKTLRIKYDQETSAIEEYIDIDEESKEYMHSKKKYEERKQELQKLNHQYRQLKTMHVESMMKTDPKLMAIIHKFIEENRQVIAHCVYQNQVFILCKQKVWVRRSHPSRNNLQRKFHKKSSQQEKKEKCQSPNRDSKNTSSEDEMNHPQYRHVIRTFKFYNKEIKNDDDKNMEAEHRVSFYPMDRYLEIPHYKQSALCGIAYEPSVNAYIIHSQDSFFLFSAEYRKNSEISSGYIKTGAKIIFCEVGQKNTLYIGTSDSVVRVYQILPDQSLKLLKIIACSYLQYTKVTHFCKTSNPDVLLFVENQNKLCEMNLSTYTSYLLSELPDPIVRLDQRCILTQNLLYVDYYIASGTRGKVSLQHNSRIKKWLVEGKKELLKLIKYQGMDYALVDAGNGNYEITPFSSFSKDKKSQIY